MYKRYMVLFVLLSAICSAETDHNLKDLLIFFGNQPALRNNSTKWILTVSEKAFDNKRYLDALDGYASLYKKGHLKDKTIIYKLIQKNGLASLLDLLADKEQTSSAIGRQNINNAKSQHAIEFLRYLRSFCKTPNFSSYKGQNPFIQAFLDSIEDPSKIVNEPTDPMDDSYGIYDLIRIISQNLVGTELQLASEPKPSPLITLLRLCKRAHQPTMLIYKTWPLLALAIESKHIEKSFLPDLIKEYPFLVVRFNNRFQNKNRIKDALASILDNGGIALNSILLQRFTDQDIQNFILARTNLVLDKQLYYWRSNYKNLKIIFRGAFTKKEISTLDTTLPILHSLLSFLPFKTEFYNIYFCKTDSSFSWDLESRSSLLSYRILDRDKAELAPYLAKALFFAHIMENESSKGKLYPLWLPTAFANHFFGTHPNEAEVKQIKASLLFPLTPTSLMTLPYQARTDEESKIYEVQSSISGQIIFNNLSPSEAFIKLRKLISSANPIFDVLSPGEREKLENLMGYQ